jgi:uroporphyrinogen decarboxylase
MIGLIRNMLTFEGLAYATYDYPEMVEDMVETCCVLVENALDQLLPHFQFDFACGWEDICFKNGPIVSVDFFQNVITPRYKDPQETQGGESRSLVDRLRWRRSSDSSQFDGRRN